VVNRGQLEEYEQQAPQAWQGLGSGVMGCSRSMTQV
jgi:hypothetical protein